MSCRCSICPTSGWRAGRRCPVRPRPRWSAICPKCGGARPNDRNPTEAPVILADPQSTLPGIGGRATLDELFQRAAARQPDALALIDPPNRAAFTDGAPRQLSYAEAD